MTQSISIKNAPYMLSAIALAAALSFVAVSPEASALPPPPPTTMECPTQISSSRSTERVSSPWRVSSQARRLQSIRVERTGGRQTLVCDYGKGGKIWRYAPSGYSCSAPNSSTVFACYNTARRARPAATPRRARSSATTTPALTRTARQFASGQIILRANNSADFDGSQTRRGGRRSHDDVRFYSKHGLQWLESVGRARIALLDTSARDYDACRDADYGKTIRMPRIRPGSNFCIRTQEGKVSNFQVQAVSTDRSGKVGNLSIRYTTWRPIVQVQSR